MWNCIELTCVQLSRSEEKTSALGISKLSFSYNCNLFFSFFFAKLVYAILAVYSIQLSVPLLQEKKMNITHFLPQSENFNFIFHFIIISGF